MADETDAATAELCAELGAALPPPEDGATAGDGAGGDSAPAAGAEGPRWRPLVLVPLPGLDTIVGVVKPPLDIIKALLGVVAALLSVLSAILVGLLDPYRALILAAYQLLKDLINDLLNAGAYFYYDAPEITSREATLAEMGFPTEPAKTFAHGRTGAPPPPPVPDAYVKWGERFAQSLDDPGDKRRPILSDGASVMAVFIVAAAPSPQALRQMLYLLGKLFNVQAFIDGWERFRTGSPDPSLTRARTDSVAPDWESIRLKDLFPQLQALLALPEALRALLLTADGAVALLKDMARAIQEKVQVLIEMANAIQAVIDLLDALRATGFHVLPVMSTRGAAGLKEAFVQAANRPPGGFIGGICLLASGPGAADATVLWNLLGQGGAFEQLESAAAQTRKLVDEAAKREDLAGKLENLEGTARRAGADLQAAVERAPEAFAADLVRPVDEVVEAVRKAPAALKDLSDEADRVFVDEAIARGEAWIEASRKRGPRSLALGLGANVDSPAPPAPAAEGRDDGGPKQP